MIVSLGELAETAKKATIGCGHSYGIAEEMATATRWLCERGFHGADKLVHALQQFEPVELEINRSADTLKMHGANGVALPALAVAPSIAELLIAHRNSGLTIAISALAQPLLLLPFLARAVGPGETLCAHGTMVDGSSVALEFKTSGVQVFARDAISLIQARADDVLCRWGEVRTDEPTLHSAEQLHRRRKTTIDGGYRVDDKVWKKLQGYAFNTYVPVSDASRLSGAGAGTTDND